jgi:stearoyl-CoA desaturase (delta-9 desaturase)
MLIFAFLVAHFSGSVFFQTFFQHRYASHKMFTMSKGWERFFYLCSFVTQGSSFLVPRAYAILHRQHHAYSDTPKDPHSPTNSKDVAEMMLKTAVSYGDLVDRTVEVEDRFLGDYPEIEWIDRVSQTWGSRLTFGTAYVLFYIAFATHWWMFLLLPIHFLAGPIQGAIVNWGGHRYGYRNFDNGDDSRNSLPVDIVTLGELCQNNHHKFPMDPNFAVRGFELDLAYQIIRIFALLRIIRMRPHAQKMRWPAPAPA